MKKIVVVGTSGCGKTTLAKKLSALTEIPFTDLDDLYWLPNWVARDEEELMRRIQHVTSYDSWIISGNCTRAKIWEKADLIVWLDYPFFTCLFRALKRSFRRMRTGEACCNGNQETLARLFSSESIITYIVTSYRRRRKNYLKLHRQNKERFIIITSQEEEEAFLSRFSRNGGRYAGASNT